MEQTEYRAEQEFYLCASLLSRYLSNKDLEVEPRLYTKTVWPSWGNIWWRHEWVVDSQASSPLSFITAESKFEVLYNTLQHFIPMYILKSKINSSKVQFSWVKISSKRVDARRQIKRQRGDMDFFYALKVSKDAALLTCVWWISGMFLEACEQRLCTGVYEVIQSDFFIPANQFVLTFDGTVLYLHVNNATNWHWFITDRHLNSN